MRTITAKTGDWLPDAQRWLTELIAEFEALSYEDLVRLLKQQSADREALVRFRDFPGGRLCADPVLASIGRVRRRISVEIVVVPKAGADVRQIPAHYFERYADGRLRR